MRDDGVLHQPVTGRSKSKWIPEILMGIISRTWQLIRLEGGMSGITQISGVSDCTVLFPEKEMFALEQS